MLFLEWGISYWYSARDSYTCPTIEYKLLSANTLILVKYKQNEVIKMLYNNLIFLRAMA